jgi:hypothetical protein
VNWSSLAAAAVVAYAAARCRQTEFGFGLWPVVFVLVVGPKKAIFFYHNRNNSHDETTIRVQYWKDLNKTTYRHPACRRISPIVHHIPHQVYGHCFSTQTTNCA